MLTRINAGQQAYSAIVATVPPYAAESRFVCGLLVGTPLKRGLVRFLWGRRANSRGWMSDCLARPQDLASVRRPHARTVDRSRRYAQQAGQAAPGENRPDRRLGTDA